MSLKNIWCECIFWVSVVMPKYGSCDKQIFCSYHLIMQNILYSNTCPVHVWLMEFWYLSFLWSYGKGSWKNTFLFFSVYVCDVQFKKIKIFLTFFSMLLNIENSFSANTYLKTNIFVLCHLFSSWPLWHIRCTGNCEENFPRAQIRSPLPGHVYLKSESTGLFISPWNILKIHNK
jgi:hypothetical protein